VEVSLSRYPLSELAGTPDVRQAKRFRKTAADLTGEQLAEPYGVQQQSGGGGLVEPVLSPAKPPKGEAQSLAAEWVEACKKGQSITLPGDRTLELCGRGVSAQEKDAPGIDLVGVDSDNRLTVVALRYTAPDATRCAVGDTPLRLLVEGLASTALAEGERASLEAALAVDGRTLHEDPPSLLIVAMPRYWELCRKREAQQGAGWIHELERLARQLEPTVGVTVEYLTVEAPQAEAAEPGAEAPAETIEFVPAWERGAGVVKVRKKSTKGTPAEIIIEADPERPPRIYSARDQYEPGDTIHHPTLGSGVVQRELGPTKVEVLFEDTRKLLVQGRG
jgi:hypothetical protein